MNNTPDWYTIRNIDVIDSPALVVYKKRIEQNISLAINSVDDVSLLRPHVKTSKIAEVCSMMLEAGITKFKCATIAEAQMLATISAPDVLLAYQPVGPKAARLLALVQQYPQTRFSCLVDDPAAAAHLSNVFSEQDLSIDVFIDLNTGMNRSGIQPVEAASFFNRLNQLPALHIAGLHAYDGHIHDADEVVRRQKITAAFRMATTAAIQTEDNSPLKIIAGGSVSFPFFRQQGVECSPGTFVFWDAGYKHLLPGEPFRYAALVVTRVVSIVDTTTITTDLGHKSVAAENPLPRVHFLNAPGAKPVSQSEEHLVLSVADSARFKTGDVLYGVPVHICPTVALYEKAAVVEDHQAVTSWKITARDRSIGI